MVLCRLRPGLHAVLQVEVDTDCILVSAGGQQVRREGTAQ